MKVSELFFYVTHVVSQHIPCGTWSMSESTALFFEPPGKRAAYAPILSFKLVYFCTRKVGDAKTY